MSLSTHDAINSAIADLINAKLCLLDATDVNVREEVETIESVTHYLEDKLRRYLDIEPERSSHNG